MKSTLLRLLVIGAMALGLAAPAAVANAAPRSGPSPTGSAGSGHGGSQAGWPDRIELPDGFQPEGITIGKEPVAYLGSRGNGDIYAADLRTGAGRIISQGPGTPSVGLKTNGRGLLYVSGGTAGNARVVDIRTGAIVASYQFGGTTGSFVNDVVLTKTEAWFTDSTQAKLYAVPLDRQGRPAAAWFKTLPLTGDWTQTTGNNANGLTETPDGRALLVVQSSTGFLFRVDKTTGVATQVDLGSALLTNGDGLLLEGRTLYVVQNRLNQVAEFSLNNRGTAGRLVGTSTDADFDVPTTVAAYGKYLYLPNARFGIANPTTAEYWITRIPRP